MRRIILDEGVPKGLATRLRKHGIDAIAFPNSWKQLSNGMLLNEIERQGFEVLITNDKQMQFQQNITTRKLAVVVLPTNLRIEVFKLIDEVVDAVRRVEAGSFLQVASSPKRET